MDRIKSSDDRWKRFAGTLEDSLRERTKRHGFINNLNLIHELSLFFVGKISGEPQAINRPQGFKPPYPAA